MDSIFGPDCYLAKVEWTKEGDALIAQILDRRQKKLALVMFNAVSGARTTLHMEEAIDDKSWVNLNESFRVMNYIPGDKLRFLWASEADGFRHLYVRETNLSDPSSGSQEVYRVTGPGEFIVDDVVGLDDMEKKVVYYLGTSPNNWLNKQLFRASLKSSGGGDIVCLTPEDGIHACKVDVKAGIFVDSVSTINKPTTVTLNSLDSGKALLDIHDAGAEDDRVSKLNLRPPTFHTFPSTDKKVTLQSAIYMPDKSTYGPGPYPLIVATYGGPHVQYVCNTWGMMTADLRTQYLCENVSQVYFCIAFYCFNDSFPYHLTFRALL